MAPYLKIPSFLLLIKVYSFHDVQIVVMNGYVHMKFVRSLASLLMVTLDLMFSKVNLEIVGFLLLLQI
jgi:hypothetical protein